MADEFEIEDGMAVRFGYLVVGAAYLSLALSPALVVILALWALGVV